MEAEWIGIVFLFLYAIFCLCVSLCRFAVITIYLMLHVFIVLWKCLYAPAIICWLECILIVLFDNKYILMDCAILFAVVVAVAFHSILYVQMVLMRKQNMIQNTINKYVHDFHMFFVVAIFQYIIIYIIYCIFIAMEFPLISYFIERNLVQRMKMIIWIHFLTVKLASLIIFPLILMCWLLEHSDNSFKFIRVNIKILLINISNEEILLCYENARWKIKIYNRNSLKRNSISNMIEVLSVFCSNYSLFYSLW